MNDLEQKLYTKGLENLYGSVLLGEDCALNHIENLVYLTRELTAPPLSRLPVSEETAFIQGRCSVQCLPGRGGGCSAGPPAAAERSGVSATAETGAARKDPGEDGGVAGRWDRVLPTGKRWAHVGAGSGC